jgi:uncharacterized protein (DUF302 family)
VRRSIPVLLFALFAGAPAAADELLMVRADLPFAEAMNGLQEAVRARGYEVARVQRVDVGLKSRGYETAEYRLVFLGKAAELERIAARHPELLPYLPLKVVVFAEGDSTLALTLSPEALGRFFTDVDLKEQLRRWEADLRAILDRFAHAL